jgi:hypothetical protein
MGFCEIHVPMDHQESIAGGEEKEAGEKKEKDSIGKI